MALCATALCDAATARAARSASLTSAGPSVPVVSSGPLSVRAVEGAAAGPERNASQLSLTVPPGLAACSVCTESRSVSSRIGPSACPWSAGDASAGPATHEGDEAFAVRARATSAGTVRARHAVHRGPLGRGAPGPAWRATAPVGASRRARSAAASSAPFGPDGPCPDAGCILHYSCCYEGGK